MKNKTITVHSWTSKSKYDCPDCGTVKSISHPDYTCEHCKQKFKLKVKLNLSN